MDKIEKQEEYDLELEIPDEFNDKIINAKINAKIKFIWSNYKFYQDLFIKSERTLQNYNAMLQKTYHLLDNLNEPLKFFNIVEEGVDNIIKREEADIKKQYNTIDSLKTDNKQQQAVAQIENFVKSTFSK